MSQNERTNQSGPSLEIDLAEIERIASELDAEADDPIPVKKTRKKTVRLKSAPVAATEEPAAEPGEVVAVIDPEFESMLIHGASQGIDLMRDKLELMEPGDTLRENVGRCLAKLVARLKPMKEGPMSDVVTIAGYLGVWALCGRDWSKKPEATASPNS